MPRRDYSENTTHRFIEVFDFKHFSRHFTFDRAGKNELNKELKSYEWHLAVERDSSRSRFDIKYPKVKPYYIIEKYMSIGKTKINYEGQDINIFDKDRTICDVVRNESKIDREIVNQAIKSYLVDPKKNTSNLLKYAKKMRAENKVRTMIGV